MRTELKQEIIRLLILNRVETAKDRKIEEIADRFPGEYSSEQEYVGFQQAIAGIVEEIFG